MSSKYSGTEGNIRFWNWIFPKASVVCGSWAAWAARTGAVQPLFVSRPSPDTGKAGREMTSSEQPGQDKRESYRVASGITQTLTHNPAWSPS